MSNFEVKRAFENIKQIATDITTTRGCPPSDRHIWAKSYTWWEDAVKAIGQHYSCLLLEFTDEDGKYFLQTNVCAEMIANVLHPSNFKSLKNLKNWSGLLDLDEIDTFAVFQQLKGE